MWWYVPKTRKDKCKLSAMLISPSDELTIQQHDVQQEQKQWLIDQEWRPGIW